MQEENRRRPDAIKVVVVDDSLTIRRWLNSEINQYPRLQIVGMAGSAQEAREIIKTTQPDILTLDIEMPGMDGLEFLSHLMRLHPMPVVMLSSGMWGKTQAAQQALKIGAIACLTKPQFPTQESMATLCESIFAAATGQPNGSTEPEVRNTGFAKQILLIGASTGGVRAIETMLESMEATEIPPIVIAQHMPQQYLENFAHRLDQLGRHDVKLSSHGMRLAPGNVRIAPSKQHWTYVVWRNGAWHIQEINLPQDQTCNPSINALFASAVPWASQVGAVLLTGLGRDGAKGMLALRRNGARTLGQTKESCIAYGMPGSAHSLNASEDQAPIEKIGRRILFMMQQKKLHAAMI